LTLYLNYGIIYYKKKKGEKMKLPTKIEKVLEFLNIEYTKEDVIYKEAFLTTPENWVIDSIYESGSFKMLDEDTVEQVIASFDENENKIVKSIKFIVTDEVQYNATTEFENDKFIIQSYTDVDTKNLESLAKCYDLYVEARESDYREGVTSNNGIIKDMEDLGVFKFVVKNYTPMMSKETYDWELIGF